MDATVKFEEGLISMIWGSYQCDQIGQFIALWATFQSLGSNYFAKIAHILGQFL